MGRKTLLWLIFFSNLHLFIHAQTRIHRVFSVDQGLCQSQIFDLVGDAKGYIWVATTNGISRWDGLHSENYGSAQGLTAATVFCLLLTRNGTLYAGTNNGLAVMHDDRFTFVGKDKSLATANVWALAEDTQGNIIVGTYAQGVFRLKGDSLVRMGHEKLNKLSVTQLALHPDGSLYVATQGGLYICRDGVFTDMSDKNDFGGERIRDIFIGSDTTIYIGTSGQGLKVVKRGVIRTLNTEKGLSNNFIGSIAESGDRILIGTQDGVNILDRATLKVLDRIGTDQGLSNGYVRSIWVTPNGTTVLGTWGGGLCVYDGDRVVSITKYNGLPSNEITAITRTHAGMIVMGSMKGVIFYDPEKNNYRVLDEKQGLVHNHVSALIADYEDNVFIGTSSGLSVWRNGRIRTIDREKILGSSNYVRAAYMRRDSSIVFGTYGMAEWKKDQLSRRDVVSDRVGNRVISFMEDNSRTLYVGTRGSGVRIFARDRTDSITTLNGLSSNLVFCIQQLQDGNVAIGTEAGINIFDPADRRVKDTIDQRDGLSHNTVLSVIEDNSGRWYCLTAAGVSVVHRLENRWHIRHMDVSDGLPSMEGIQSASYRAPDGRIWFGTVRGIAIIDPQKDIPDKIAPKVHIQRLRVFEKDLPISTLPMMLTYNENYLKFDYTGIDLRAPEKIIYQYRMIGVDKEWITDKRNYVQYTNLDDGEYRFEVRAANTWGVWGEPESVRFTIRPAWWETWWFIGLSILLSAGVIGIVIYSRVQQWVAVERLRSKISADLHDDIGSGLTEIYMLSELGKQQLERGQIEDSITRMDRISVNAQYLVKSMSDIVWLINPKNDSVFDMIIRLRDGYRDLLEQLNISFETQNLDALQSIRMPMDYRQHLYFIFKEALNNSLKYSKCTSVFMSAAIDDLKLIIELRDNGKGLSNTNPTSGNGLNNMRHRASLIGGVLDIQSTEGQGVRILFSGKIKSQHIVGKS